MAEFREGFENGSYDYEGIREVTIPKEWIAAWWEGNHDTPNGVQYFNRPEYDMKDTRRGHSEVYAGYCAANLFSASKVHNGCLIRGFNIGRNRLLTAEVMSMIKSPNAARDTGHEMRIGVDPGGGLDMDAPTVRWSGWYSTGANEYVHGAWVRQAVTTVSDSDWVTVFLHSRNVYWNVWSHAHWDEFVLTYEGTPEPPVPPPPSGGEFDWERLARAHEAFAAVLRGQ